MIIEVERKGSSYLKRYYNNDPLKMVLEGDGLQWTEERIKSAFNFGRGTEKDLFDHIELNRKYCLFYDTEKQCFI